MKNGSLISMSAWFVVTGMKFSPLDCTAHFGVEPTDVLTEGEIRPGKRPPVPHSSWTIKTKKIRVSNSDEVFQLLLGVIWPKRQMIMDYSKEHDLKITFVLCAAQNDDEQPFYCLSAQTINQISYFNAPLHMDI
jgi:hypothetical protein